MGIKRNVPHLLQAQQAPVCGQYQKRSSAKSSTASPPSQLFQEGMLEFDGPMGQCFGRFPTVSSRRRGGKEEERYGIDNKSHIPYLQVQLAFV